MKLQICSECGPVMLKLRSRTPNDRWSKKCQQKSIDTQETSALKSYWRNNTSGLPVPGKTMFEHAQRKFTVFNARSSRVVKFIT